MGLIPLLQDYYYALRVLVSKVHLGFVLRGSCTSESLHRAPQLGKDGRKGHPMRRGTVPTSTPPPLGVAGGWPCRTQLCVATADGPKSTQTQCRLHRKGNVPPVGVSPYTRVPILSLAKCGPPLTMCGGCDMEGRPCYLSFPCCYGIPLGRRGPLGSLKILKGGRFLETRRVRHQCRKAPIGPGLKFTSPPIRRPHGGPPPPPPGAPGGGGGGRGTEREATGSFFFTSGK